MKNKLTFAFLILVHSFFFGQISINISLPDTITLNTQTSFTVKINKEAISGLAKYEMSVPEGSVVKAEESRGGAFTFENNIAKIIWAKVPEDTTVVLKMILLPSSETGMKVLTQKFEYMQNNERKEVSANPVNIFFKNGSLNDSIIANVKEHEASNTPTITSAVKVSQLKKDSKQAYEIGKREQEMAAQRIVDAEKEIKQAEKIKDEEERKEALAKAVSKKKKAENDKMVADKIVALSKTLDENAQEIELAVNVSPDVPNETVYYIQIGAFSQNPTQTLSKHLGVIRIVLENHLYKVLYGKYKTKEEALNKRLEMLDRGFQDCFVVAYQNGKRVN